MLTRIIIDETLIIVKKVTDVCLCFNVDIIGTVIITTIILCGFYEFQKGKTCKMPMAGVKCLWLVLNVQLALQEV